MSFSGAQAAEWTRCNACFRFLLKIISAVFDFMGRYATFNESESFLRLSWTGQPNMVLSFSACALITSVNLLRDGNQIDLNWFPHISVHFPLVVYMFSHRSMAARLPGVQRASVPFQNHPETKLFHCFRKLSYLILTNLSKFTSSCHFKDPFSFQVRAGSSNWNFFQFRCMKISVISVQDDIHMQQILFQHIKWISQRAAGVLVVSTWVKLCILCCLFEGLVRTYIC